MKKNLVRFLATLAITFSAQALATPILVFNGEQLAGAKGVDVNGVSYDVTFRGHRSRNCDGGGCMDAHEFTNLTDARSASDALMNQVFADTPTHQLDSQSNLTLGCEDGINACLIMTIYNNQDYKHVKYSGAFNLSGTAADKVFNGEVYASDAIFDGWEKIHVVVAHWNISEASLLVPEPSSGLALLGAGLLSIAIARRRRSLGSSRT